MRRAYGQWWYHDRDSPRSTSHLAALLATGVLFTAAFLAMTRVRVPALDLSSASDNPPVVVYMTPEPVAPAPPVRQPARPRPIPAPAPVTSVPRPGPITVIPAPITRPAPAPRVARDTAVSRANLPSPALVLHIKPTRDVPEFRPPPSGAGLRGAPMAPAGVTGRAAPLTTAERDSIVTSKIGRMIAEARSEAGTSGGVGAVGSPKGTVGAGVSIPFPLFSPGPSPAERRRNEALDSAYQLRLRRLQDLAIARRDSARADSLRRNIASRDSLPD